MDSQDGASSSKAGNSTAASSSDFGGARVAVTGGGVSGFGLPPVGILVWLWLSRLWGGGVVGDFLSIFMVRDSSSSGKFDHAPPCSTTNLSTMAMVTGLTLEWLTTEPEVTWIRLVAVKSQPHVSPALAMCRSYACGRNVASAQTQAQACKTHATANARNANPHGQMTAFASRHSRAHTYTPTHARTRTHVHAQAHVHARAHTHI